MIKEYRVITENRKGVGNDKIRRIERTFAIDHSTNGEFRISIFSRCD
ncbi:hypothetical protein GCM10010954_32710 [Halobacillus andaensis]|uniref:Uncharacterized protein n=1 Tax=Halobacillus andaensis TaxID=1176239 RepID=A0A917B9Q8_HALAA|nr:hypothetical protein GCM10010954_32710 [Halobacillus andaensis]